MFSYRTLFTTVLALASVTSQATTLAGWTFETSAPVTAGPISAEIGGNYIDWIFYLFLGREAPPLQLQVSDQMIS